MTSPPYDVVVRPDGVHHLETADPYNIVRLILPQADDHDARQGKAAGTLRRWRAEGVLALDPEPALYVYEQRRGDLLQRGLIGALRLSPPEDGVVLPHEGVIAEVVEDRAALMRGTAANLEPLLLSYRGDGTVTGATAVIERAAQRARRCSPPPPRTASRTGCGRSPTPPNSPRSTHDSSATARADRRRPPPLGDLSAAPRRTPHQRPGSDSPPSPPGTTVWSCWSTPPAIRCGSSAIHRVLPQLPPRKRAGAVRERDAFRVTTLELPLAQALAALDEAPGNAFLLTDGGPTSHLLDRPSRGLLDRTLDEHRPESWRRLDATVLHSVLLDEVWRIPDRPDEISYIHDSAAAVGKARQLGGTAVLMRPLREDVVRELAEQGVMMPRKSTSFGPKPATGLVLRVLDEDVR